MMINYYIYKLSITNYLVPIAFRYQKLDVELMNEPYDDGTKIQFLIHCTIDNQRFKVSSQSDAHCRLSTLVLSYTFELDTHSTALLEISISAYLAQSQALARRFSTTMLNYTFELDTH